MKEASNRHYVGQHTSISQEIKRKSNMLSTIASNI